MIKNSRQNYIVTFVTVDHCGICDQIDTSTSSGVGETGVDTADMVVGDKYKNSIVTLPRESAIEVSSFTRKDVINNR